ncbi:adenosylcobalamin-dependent ribonucleoside-diphosphate reductase [Phosphitispora fastidiosa]|uniref:adenosylcobalamin-dependent ribonucleoside-diphosphate reductase n=1 Tax=Phosphitispora fastidiosa TaxID=2837202 RepID=UPI001E5CD306|nr:adenosylcobalamin-dependent ribonucleoside-diphosphate reductase [Phosphitispora fastidiosa]MBU7007075.1 ribonucleoside-diphosphate reductase alpha chain [Phosphitispora fastidiosa]
MEIFSSDSLDVLERRYLIKDSSGKVIETPEGMLKRAAKFAALPEENQTYWEERFFELMSGLRFLPNSPTLANAGKPNGQMAACFVLPVPDSIEGIFETMKRAALIHKTGGGTGFSFSNIRPKDDIVSSTGGVASGPVPFIRAFNSATDAVKQGGMRRGANMAVLDYWHPDILEFINMKEEEDVLTNFNISIGVDNRFMDQVVNRGDIDQINPRTGKVNGRTIPAATVFDAMTRAAWANGEPGILFFDHINKANTVPGSGPMKATNPCGEQPLLNYESCNLGSLNLTAFLNEAGEGYRRINWSRLAEDTAAAVRFLDNIIDVNKYIFTEIERVTKGNRKIGLGVMGFADLLIELGIPYASMEALELIETLMGFIRKKAMEASAALGREKGPFPNIEKSVYKGETVRNATVTTIAPTGTLSMLAGTSSGIEPLFGLSFVKEVLEGRKFYVTSRSFEEAARKGGFWSEDLVQELAHTGSLEGIKGIPEDVRRVFATAFEISPQWHLKVQAAFQKHVDNAVSKTINFPAGAAIADIRSAYLMAWKYGLKGLTIYRNGSRSNQVLKFASKDMEKGTLPAGCSTCPE